MAYREADFFEPCAQCETAAVVRCARCVRFFCAAHLITDLCTPCEEEFLARTQRSSWWRAPVSMVVGAAAVLACFVAGAIVGADAGALAIGIGLSVLAGSSVALEAADDRAHRRAFVRELHRGRVPKALPAAP